MYDIIKRVIESGNYQLPKVLEKIDVSWAEGSITDDQRRELTDLAQKGADPAKDADLLAKITDLERRVRALEGNQTDGATEAYPPYVEGKWYYAGDGCSENGKNYVCCAPEGVVCVWSPTNYPAYWKEVTEND